MHIVYASSFLPKKVGNFTLLLPLNYTSKDRNNWGFLSWNTGHIRQLATESDKIPSMVSMNIGKKESVGLILLPSHKFIFSFLTYHIYFTCSDFLTRKILNLRIERLFKYFPMVTFLFFIFLLCYISWNIIAQILFPNVHHKCRLQIQLSSEHQWFLGIFIK